MRATCGVMSARTPSEPARQRIDDLERLQVEVAAAAGQQRFEMLDRAAAARAGSRARESGRAACGAALRAAPLRREARRRSTRAAASYAWMLARINASTLGRYRPSSPMPIDTRPTKRSWPSVSSVSRRKRLAPDARRDERQQPFENQQQRERRPQRILHAVPCVVRSAASISAGRARVRRTPVLLEVLEELGARVEHHQVALVAERRLVRLEAAVERIELGVLRRTPARRSPTTWRRLRP